MRHRFLSTLGDGPNPQPLRSSLGQLERTRERIGFRPGLAEIIGVKPHGEPSGFRKAARQAALPSNLVVTSLRACAVPQSLSNEVPDTKPSGFSTSLRPDRSPAARAETSHTCRASRPRNTLPCIQHGQLEPCPRAQVAVLDEQVVAEAIVAEGIVVQAGHSVECGLWKGVRRPSWRMQFACCRRSGCGRRRRLANYPAASRAKGKGCCRPGTVHDRLRRRSPGLVVVEQVRGHCAPWAIQSSQIPRHVR